MTLKGKVALITGGSRGIGAATAKRLAAEGAAVAITYSNSKDRADQVVAEIKAKGGKAAAYLADAAKPDTLPALVPQVLKDFGQIDILVNNAGTFDPGKAIGELVPEDYDRVTRVNVEAVYRLTNAVVPHLKAGARIINVSSVLGVRAMMPGISGYVSSKFAVSGLTRAWAQDLGSKGILVNAVLPGPVDTEMNPANGEHADSQKQMIPLGRYGKPEEIAGVVAFLSGPDSTFVHGALIEAGGGANA